MIYNKHYKHVLTTNSLISVSSSTNMLFDSTINWYSGSASTGPNTTEIIIDTHISDCIS